MKTKLKRKNFQLLNQLKKRLLISVQAIFSDPNTKPLKLIKVQAGWQWGAGGWGGGCTRSRVQGTCNPTSNSLIS